MEHKKTIHFSGDTAPRLFNLFEEFKDIIILCIVFIFIILPYRFIGQSYTMLMKSFMSKIGPSLPAHQRVIDNLDLALPELSDSDRKDIAQKSWENVAYIPYEFIASRYNPQLLNINVNGLEILDVLKQENKQILFFSGHNACWELIRPFLHTHGMDTAIIYRPFNNRFMDAYARKLMNYGFAPVFQKTNMGIRKMIKHIKNKKHIFMLTDQRLGTGELLNFFGKPAMTTPSAAELAIKYDLALVPVFVVRKSLGDYDILIHPPMDIACDATDSSQQTRAIIQEMNNIIENHIRKFPNDWFWLHRRWK